MLRTRHLQEEQWDQILPEALHAVRSLFCTATSQTLHERFLCLERRSILGRSLPACLLTPGPVLMKRFIRNKSEPLVDRVELLSANPHFVFIRCADGQETSVSTRNIAPCPSFAEQEPSCETVYQQDTCIEQSSGSSHAAVDRENFTDTFLNKTEAVAVRGSSDEPLTTSLQVQTNMPPDLHRRFLALAGRQGCGNTSDAGLTMNGLQDNFKICIAY